MGFDARPGVLVVDDQADVARALARVLHRDFCAEPTTSCARVLERVQAGERFAAIVCELSMHEMSGVELHDRIRRIAPDQARRMVFLTAGVLSDELSAFARAHASIEKPFVHVPLRDRIWSFVSRPIAFEPILQG